MLIRSGFLLLILVAFALRVLLLDAQSLWYDEGVTAIIAQYDLRALTRWTAADIQPPFYYYIVAAWGRMAGWSEWSLRFVSAWFGTLLVPLMAALATRLTRSRTAGWLTALLTALHPLLIYYSQEARMYSLLTGLGVLVGYCVVRLGEGENRPTLWIAYVVAATAAIYTHYFAFFLLLALAIAYLTDSRQSMVNGQWSTVNIAERSLRKRQSTIDNVAERPLRERQSTIDNLRPFFLANLLVLLLYLPWFFVMITQLSRDTSYWQGTLKLGEALRSIAISFTSGETVYETDGIWLLFGYALITAGAIIRLARRPALRRTLRYGLLWLVVPVLAALVLAAFAPKFNARYVMLALPGLLAVWGGGLSASGSRLKSENSRLKIEDSRLGGGVARNRQTARTPIFNLQSSVFNLLAILFILTASAYATFNWFASPAFTKDDWRGVTEFLRPRLQEQEAIALISGHTWPVWEYYAPDLPALRLPDLRILDVEAVIDFADTAAPLQAALDPLSERPGIWLVMWQDDVIDPTGVVPAQLTIAGKEKGLDTAYWGLTLRRFSQLKTHWIPDEPPIQQAADVQFGEHLVLHGYGAIDNGDLLLFWQHAPGSKLADSSFVIGGEVFDAAGRQIARLPDLPPAGFDYPAHRWPPNRMAMGVIPAQAWLGYEPAPGRYTVTLRVYDDLGGARTLLPADDGAESVTLGPIEVVIE